MKKTDIELLSEAEQELNYPLGAVSKEVALKALFLSTEQHRKNLSDFDIWLAGEYEYVGGNWYSVDDDNGEHPIAMVELFDSFTPSLKSNQLQATVDELKNRCEELDKSKWVSMEERLPEDSDEVLTYIKDLGLTVICFYDPEEPELGWQDSEGYHVSVTHWQPLPPPPSQT